MKKTRKRLWVYVVGMFFSAGMAVYGFWSLKVFASSVQLTKALLKGAAFYHPWKVWLKVSKAYVQHSGNWDPAASAHFIFNCMHGMAYIGILLLALFIFLFVFELIRKGNSR